MYLNLQCKHFRSCLITPSDRVCQQQGLSLWVPFQNAATAVTNLYKGKLRNFLCTLFASYTTIA